jgi:hypothetical protein
MKTYKMTTKKVNQKTNKNYWLEVGTIFVNDQGQMSGYLNANPDVQIYLFENQPKQQTHQNPGAQGQPYQQQQPKQQQPGNISFSDQPSGEIPF